MQSAPQVGIQIFCVASNGEGEHVSPLDFCELPRVVQADPMVGFATTTRSMHTMLVTAITTQASNFRTFTFYTVSAG